MLQASCLFQLPVSCRRTAPPYGHRKGWVPRTHEVNTIIPLIHFLWCVSDYPLNSVVLLNRFTHSFATRLLPRGHNIGSSTGNDVGPPAAIESIS